MTGRDVLLGAAALIRERGLAKHTFQDWQGRLCILGACRVAAGADHALGDVPRANAAALSDALYGRPGMLSVHFNDRPETTAEDVAQFLERRARS